jgi:hypothetical protein
MPSSRSNVIPVVVNLVLQLKPRSILDVGVGFGKWGHLFREYTDIVAAEEDHDRYQRHNWRVRIDGIEGFPDYLTEMHRYLYDTIHIGEMTEVLPRLGRYDLVFMGDVIEHLDKARGQSFLREALEHADKALVVATPKFECPQHESCGNHLEIHRSLWTGGDFESSFGAQVRTVDRTNLLAVIRKPGVEPLSLAHPIHGEPQRARLLLRRAAIAVLGEKAWNRVRGHTG